MKECVMEAILRTSQVEHTPMDDTYQKIYFPVGGHHLLSRAEENHENPQSKYGGISKLATAE